jgi:hypothetical protein
MLLEHHSSSNEMVVNYCPDSLNFIIDGFKGLIGFCSTSCVTKNENKKLQLLRADFRLGVLPKKLRGGREERPLRRIPVTSSSSHFNC